MSSRMELLYLEWADRIMSWRHSGFLVHRRVRAKTKPEAERVGKYTIWQLLSLERQSFLEPKGKISYRYGQDAAERETINYLEFIFILPPDGEIESSRWKYVGGRARVSRHPDSPARGEAGQV